MYTCWLYLQCYVLAANCKERWKNLRTVFVRKLKLPPSGSARKNRKPYYLMESMQFIFPFIKTQNNDEMPSNVLMPSESDIGEALKFTDEVREENDFEQSTQSQEIRLEPTAVQIPDPPAKKKKKQTALPDVDRAFIDFEDIRS